MITSLDSNVRLTLEEIGVKSVGLPLEIRIILCWMLNSPTIYEWPEIIIRIWKTQSIS